MSLAIVFLLAAIEAPADGVADIVVTAERRQAAAQDVAVALTAIDGATLARRGVASVNQLQFQVPSLEVVPAFGGGQPQFRLRGVGFEDYASNNTPTVGVSIDDVAYPVPAMTQGALFDVARIEVLRGPQGTLYGRNTTGGAVNIVTNRPTSEAAAGIAVEHGRFGETRGEAYLSGPVASDLAARVSGIVERGGGFQRNRVTGQALGDADRLYGRALLRWAPGTAEVTLNVHGGRDRSDQTGLVLFDAFPTRGYGATPAGPVIPADLTRRRTGWGFRPAFLGQAGFAVDSRPQRDTDSIGGSVTVAADLGPLRLTSISAIEHLQRRELADWDASASAESDVFWGSDVTILSQETRLASAPAGRLQWVAGSYLSTQKQREMFLTDFTDSLGFVADTAYRQRVWSASGFGQVRWQALPAVTLVAGARYEHEARRLRDFRTAIAGVPTFGNGDRDAGLDEVTGRIAIEARPVRAVLLYANASRGVKSGGFTTYNSPQPDQIDAFRPEILYAYEAGAKADLGRALRLNAAAFFYDYRDQQVLGTILSPTRGLIGRITNAPRSRIWGGEVEAVVQPSPRLRLSQAIGFKRGRYRRFEDIDPTTLRQDPASLLYSVGTIDRAGQPLPIANWSYQGSASYAQPIGRFALEAAADYSYRDVLPSFLGPDFALPERWIANATLTLAPAGGGWSIGLYARNLFGTGYDLTRNYFLPNARIAAPGRPATYGVRATASF